MIANFTAVATDSPPPGGMSELTTVLAPPEYGWPDVDPQTGDLVVHSSGRRRVMRVSGRSHQHQDWALKTIRQARSHSRATGRSCVVGILSIAEFGRLRNLLGPAGCVSLLDQVADRAGGMHRWRGATVAQGGSGEVVVVVEVLQGRSAEAAFGEMAQAVAGCDFVVGREHLRVTPLPGYAVVDDTVDDATALRQARLAAGVAAQQLDMVPVCYHPRMGQQAKGRRRSRRSLRARLRLPVTAQIALSTAICLGTPFGVYSVLFELGFDPTGVAFAVLVVSLVGTAMTIYLEQLHALEPEQCPDAPAAPYPAASAIIAAYLPNESATIIDTVEAFLRLDYPGPLQIILAYNTPRNLPVEEALARIAEADPRFVAVRVQGSTSKAQNVNAALSAVTGDFVGVFDADHQPAPDAFRRAWRWLSHGAAVVQGHCVVRNGDATRVSRTVAVEFESIYAVSHPGRARMHGFGIFGGSNGYWRTDLLHQTRMRGSMLTEDIDASLRTIIAGGRIVSDPGLVSYELAPTTLTALWRQRVRWAQGWTQVSRRHLWKAFGSSALTARQKLGLAWLLGWREIYPWLSPQIYPLILFSLLHPTSGEGVRLNVSLYLLAALFSTMVGPMQALFAYALADPSIRRHRTWFVKFCLVNIFYTEFKNVIARLAPVKELLGERDWHVTPRHDQQPGPAAPAMSSTPTMPVTPSTSAMSNIPAVRNTPVMSGIPAGSAAERIGGQAPAVERVRVGATS
jgi:cellulose synthase/poly-beta-1,6-N-acetylglucosamine synthase-like glycosyltransferase